MSVFPSTQTIPTGLTKERRSNGRRGLFIVVDGLDGIGKGVVERALDEYEQLHGKATFDAISFSRAHTKGLPELTDFWDPPRVHYHTVVTAEPNYAWTGHAIRQEMIARSGRSYNPHSLIAALSVDREHSMKRVVQPALEHGLNVIQGRCVAATLCYQGHASGLKPSQLPDFAKRLCEYEGNRMQLQDFSPDLLIIPTIDDVNKVMERIQARMSRKKDDKSIFDNLEFQAQIKPFFESKELRALFEAAGTRVAYLDAGLSQEETVDQTLKIYNEFLEGLRQK